MKTTKTVLSILLVCCMVLSWSGAALAAGESVNAVGSDTSADFITVTAVETGSNDAEALGILAMSGGNADVTVKNDVTAEADAGMATGVSARAAAGSEVELEVGGSVEATSADNQSVGVDLPMGGGDISVSVDGDVTSTGCDVATGLSTADTIGTVTAEVGGSVSAVGTYNASGIDVNRVIDTTISVSGDVIGDAGKGNGYGVFVVSEAGASGTPSEVAVEVGGDVQTGSGDATAYGVSVVAMEGSDVQIDVGGSVSAFADNIDPSDVGEYALAITINAAPGGAAAVTVEGDVEATSVDNRSVAVNVGMGDGDVAVEVGGDITSTGCDVASGISTGYNGGTVTVEVGGDVSAVGEYNAEGVSVEYAIDTAITVEGNVSGDAGEGNAYGVFVSTKEGATGTPSEVSVAVGGDVTAESDDAAAYGVDIIAMEGSDVQVDVGGSVSAFADNVDPADAGETASGVSIHAAADGSAAVTVAGDVEAASVDNRSFGVDIGMGDGDVAVKVGGDVTSTGCDVAYGLSTGSTGGTVTAEIGGDVSAVGDYNACGVDVQLAIDTTITVEGDVSAQAGSGNADGVFVYSHQGAGEPSEITVEVGGELSAESENGSVSGVSAIADEGAAIDVKVGSGVSAASKNSGASAVFIKSNEGGEVSVEVGGNTTAEGSFNVYGLELYATGGTAEASLGGDVTADGEFDAVGAYVLSHGSGKANAELNGSISAESRYHSVGVDVISNNGGQAEASISGDISTESELYAYGAVADSYEEGSKSTISLNGNITVQAERGGTGIGAGANHGGVVDITMEGDIDVTSTAEEEEAKDAVGIRLGVMDGEITAQLKGDVTSNRDGIVLFGNDGGVTPAAGTITLVTEGDVTAERYALEQINDENSSAVSEVVIDGTLHGDKAGVLVSENITEDNLKLTVWKIDLNEDDNAVVSMDDLGAISSTEATRAIEESIQYIVKVEQAEGASIALSGTSKRTVLDKSYDVALESDVVTMMVSVEDGYTLNGAFNGLGEKVELLQDEDGNYFVVVPKGGGVYLSVSVSKIAPEVYYIPATIRYELEGGRIEEDEGPIKVETWVGNTIKLLQAPEREGYTFLRWELDVGDDDPIPFEPGERFLVTGNAVFTAIWEENS